MAQKQNRHKIEQSFGWVGFLLVGMGAVFLIIGLVAALANIPPETLTVTHNGVRRQTTAQDVAAFKLLFGGIFGLVGLVLLAVGAVLTLRTRSKERQARLLMEDGVQVWASVLDCAPTNVRVNHRYLYRLRCSYTAPGGQTYVFRSGSLRENPAYALPSGRVKVYYDREDITKYHVDVDGSIQEGSVTYL